MEDEYKQAMECYKEELRDVTKYTMMYKDATNPLHKQFYNDIAHDEYNHAKFLKHMLTMDGKFTSSDDIRKLEDEAEKAHTTFL